jgi:hypothetical protein
MADRIEEASSGPIELMPPTFGSNVTSLDARRTKFQPSMEENDEES